MRILFIVLSAFITAACQPSSAPDITVPEGHLAVIEIQTMDDGNWDVKMTFAEPQSALIFSRSSGDYRTASWKSQTPGASIKRHGDFDTLIFDAPATQAAFTVAPYSGMIRGDYTPALLFSKGAVAAYLGQFELLEIADKGAAAALDGNLGNWNGEQKPLTLVLKSATPLLFQGEWAPSPLSVVYPQSDGYVFMGEGEITTGQDFIGVIDTGLPEWLSVGFDAQLTATFDALRGGFGSSLPRKASVLFTFGGYEGAGFTNKGGALPGPALVLTSQGEALKVFDPATFWSLQWFFAHEGAHLFQSRTHEAQPMQSWLHEGHASAVAYDILQKRGAASQRAAKRQKGENRKCLRTLSYERPKGAGHVSTHYECGALLWNLAADMTPDHDLYSLWDAAQERIASEGGRLAQDRLFSLMIDLGADAEHVGKLEAFAEGPVSNPEEAYAELLAFSKE